MQSNGIDDRTAWNSSAIPSAMKPQYGNPPNGILYSGASSASDDSSMNYVQGSLVNAQNKIEEHPREEKKWAPHSPETSRFFPVGDNPNVLDELSIGNMKLPPKTSMSPITVATTMQSPQDHEGPLKGGNPLSWPASGGSGELPEAAGKAMGMGLGIAQRPSRGKLDSLSGDLGDGSGSGNPAASSQSLYFLLQEERQRFESLNEMRPQQVIIACL